MYKNHGHDFAYTGIDIFDEGDQYKDEVTPVKTFNPPTQRDIFYYT